MSFTGSIQQLGTGAASLIAGLLVVKGNAGQIYHFSWLGYIQCICFIDMYFFGI